MGIIVCGCLFTVDDLTSHHHPVTLRCWHPLLSYPTPQLCMSLPLSSWPVGKPSTILKLNIFTTFQIKYWYLWRTPKYLNWSFISRYFYFSILNYTPRGTWKNLDLILERLTVSLFNSFSLTTPAAIYEYWFTFVWTLYTLTYLTVVARK